MQPTPGASIYLCKKPGANPHRIGDRLVLVAR